MNKYMNEAFARVVKRISPRTAFAAGLITANEYRSFIGVRPTQCTGSLEVIPTKKHTEMNRTKYPIGYYTCEYCGVTTEGISGLCSCCGAPKINNLKE